MAEPETDFQVLLCRLQEGSEQAATELVEHFAQALRRVIRRHLDARIRPALDSTDLEQQVWISFFGRELYRDLHEPDKLREFLCGIARQKAQRATRNQFRDKRDRRREVPLEGPHLGEPLLAAQPGPEQLAQQRDEFSHLQEHLSDQECVVVDLLRQRHSLGDIASRLGTSIRTVCRIAARVKDRLTQAEPVTSAPAPGGSL